MQLNDAYHNCENIDETNDKYDGVTAIVQYGMVIGERLFDGCANAVDVLCILPQCICRSF